VRVRQRKMTNLISTGAQILIVSELNENISVLNLEMGISRTDSSSIHTYPTIPRQYGRYFVWRREERENILKLLSYLESVRCLIWWEILLISYSNGSKKAPVVSAQPEA